MKQLGEFGLIQTIRQQFTVPEGTLGIGDDCAVLPQATGRDTLVSTDMLVEGSHFLLEDISPYQLGWKSAAVNISDIAAMGGKPTASFLSFGLPKSLSAEWMQEFIRGYREISELYGVPLLGGDTTSSPDRLCISVTVMGECAHGAAILRSGAKPGDLICVSGTLGDSAAGLHVILNHLDRSDELNATLVERHYRPYPHVYQGLVLSGQTAAAGKPLATAMMDISDGIGSDLKHIMEESGVGAEVDVNALPISPEVLEFCKCEGLDPVELAVSGGEDYGLLFTVAPDAIEALRAALAESGLQHLTAIGRITEPSASNEIVWKGSDKAFGGFHHF